MIYFQLFLLCLVLASEASRRHHWEGKIEVEQERIRTNGCLQGWVRAHKKTMLVSLTASEPPNSMMGFLQEKPALIVMHLCKNLAHELERWKEGSNRGWKLCELGWCPTPTRWTKDRDDMHELQQCLVICIGLGRIQRIRPLLPPSKSPARSQSNPESYNGENSETQSKFN